MQAQVEKSTLLSKEPLSQFLVTAVGQSANEMRNVVVLALLARFSQGTSFEFSLLSEGDIFALICEPVLGQILVNSNLDSFFLVGVVPKT